jgi:predicted  nucleic acid-binding Zn-ribbon protein
LIFKQLSLENYANSLEVQLETQKAKSEREVDSVRRDLSKKLADCFIDNTRLTTEVDNLQSSNVKQAARIAELNSKVEDHQTSSESKSFFNEYEVVKKDLEKAEDILLKRDEYIKNLKDTLTQLENDSKDKIKQLVDSYNALGIKHDSLENSCKVADSEIIELKNKNSQLNVELNKAINDNLANLTDLSDQNVQLTTQLTKLQQDVATKELSVDSLRQINKGLNLDIATLQQQLAQQTAQITQPLNMTPTPPIPPTPPTAPIQNPSNQQQGPRAPSPDPNNVPLTKSHLRELYSQDERKSIPVYKGKRGDQLINNWLKDAERVAQSAGWSAKDKIKYFSDRLRGDAADWHSDYIDHAADKEDYDAWEKALISRFLTE